MWQTEVYIPARSVISGTHCFIGIDLLEPRYGTSTRFRFGRKSSEGRTQKLSLLNRSPLVVLLNKLLRLETA